MIGRCTGQEVCSAWGAGAMRAETGGQKGWKGCDQGSRGRGGRGGQCCRMTIEALSGKSQQQVSRIPSKPAAQAVSEQQKLEALCHGCVSGRHTCPEEA